MAYPVSLEVDYAERRRRLGVLFRGLLLIPLYLWVYLYGIAASFAVLFAWLSIVFTARFPEGLYRFVAGFLRVLTLTTAYGALLVDRYPPFSSEPHADYPVRLSFAGPLPRYSRLRTLFRGILAIPIYILRYAINIVLALFTFVAWFVIVVLGRLPSGLFEVLALMTGYVARSDAYLFLLTETYPPLQAQEPRAPSVA